MEARKRKLLELTVEDSKELSDSNQSPYTQAKIKEFVKYW